MPLINRRPPRERMIAALLSPRCTICAAPPGEACNPLNPDTEPLAQLDWHPPVFAHHHRIAGAARGRPVIRRRVLAQFGDDDPARAYLTGKRT